VLLVVLFGAEPMGWLQELQLWCQAGCGEFTSRAPLTACLGEQQQVAVDSAPTGVVTCACDSGRRVTSAVVTEFVLLQLVLQI
jgi:hypothetical protein